MSNEKAEKTLKIGHRLSKSGPDFTLPSEL